MKLYELTAQHKELEKFAETADKNVAMDTTLEDTFEALEGEFSDKAVSLITVTKNIDSDISAIDNEIKRLQELKKVRQNAVASMREYLRYNMEESGITKIECPLFSITLAKGSDVVEIDDVNQIPADYLDIQTIFKPRKAEILKALKSGDVPGARLVKSKPPLRIK